jgi:hypothetical protein
MTVDELIALFSSTFLGGRLFWFLPGCDAGNITV